MAESSNQNPESNMSFKLIPENVMKLKQSITALCDYEFNPNRVAMVDATEKGFEITVRNAETNAVANLFLNAPDLIDFHCNKPIVSKIIDLNRVYYIFTEAILDYTTMTVSHFHEFATNLSFKFGSNLAKEVSLEFKENCAQFNKFHAVESSCETVLSCHVLREIIQQLRRNNRTVLMNISKKQVGIFIKLPGVPFRYRTKGDDKDFQATVASPGTGYHTWFEICHLKSIEESMIASTRVHLRVLPEPKPKPTGNVMIRLNLEQLGYLEYIQKAILLCSNPASLSLVDVALGAERTS